MAGALPPPRSGLATPAAHAAAAAMGGVHGRGATFNPANRFESLSLEVLSDDVGPANLGEPPMEIDTAEDEWADADSPGAAPASQVPKAQRQDADATEAERPASLRLKTLVYRDATKSVVNKVDSPDMGINWTINPYRGCEHGCIYCYARPGHEYLGMSSGLDFESRIMAKFNAPELLRKVLLKPGWRGERIVMSGVTDAYQPVERTLGITRRVLEVMAEFRQPVSIITKSRLVLRDLDLLAALNEHGAVSVAVSLTTLDAGLARILEPRAASPAQRLATIRTLADAGIPVRVMTAPLIPAINDNELESLLEAAKAAGAGSAGYTLIRLPYQLKALFTEWLAAHYPERAAKVESLIRQTRGGAMYNSNFGQRHTGTGAIAELIAARFRVTVGRLGLDKIASRAESPFVRPAGGETDGTAGKRPAGHAPNQKTNTGSQAGQLWLFENPG